LRPTVGKYPPRATATRDLAASTSLYAALRSARFSRASSRSASTAASVSTRPGSLPSRHRRRAADPRDAREQGEALARDETVVERADQKRLVVAELGLGEKHLGAPGETDLAPGVDLADALALDADVSWSVLTLASLTSEA
jgi:hypothetical protein